MTAAPSPRGVAVSGLGMITPAGIGRETTRAGVQRARSMAATDAELKGCPVDFSCRVPVMSPEQGRIGGGKAWRMGRFTQLAVLAAREAVADAGLDPAIWDPSRVAVVIGSGLAGAAHNFALPIPSLVICLMLGVPYEDHGLFQSLSRTMLDNTTGPERAAAAHRELMAYLADPSARERDAPGDDILSRLAARPDLSAQETASLGFMLLITGHESTTNMAALSVLALLRADPELVPGAVEELLRYLTIIRLGLGRAASEDVTVGGTAIRAGEGVICMLSTANRQPELFAPEDADGVGVGPAEPDVTRDARRHLAFGHGAHQCLGHALARVEPQIILEALLRRLPGPRLAVPEDRLVFQRDTFVYGVRELPVAW
ncbi:cytochrome P450 [Streptomyces sp. NPDC087917]|uniref:cytochrome P450 n=1 Tax=Streptomyces sp. NPDC087917 TaxID=3155060 RepID=UPI0034491069